MSGIKATPVVRLVEAQDEIDAERGHLADLIFVREVLAAHGATADELRECDAVIDDVRSRLEDATRPADDDLPNAA
ncbi:MAG TPA: hypothetical protein VEH55_00240 [Gaiellaceae bacterium]|nr:hypothetical protein [Gaiellaceae bacterium]